MWEERERGLCVTTNSIFLEAFGLDFLVDQVDFYPFMECERFGLQQKEGSGERYGAKK